MIKRLPPPKFKTIKPEGLGLLESKHRAERLSRYLSFTPHGRKVAKELISSLKILRRQMSVIEAKEESAHLSPKQRKEFIVKLDRANNTIDSEVEKLKDKFLTTPFSEEEKQEAAWARKLAEDAEKWKSTPSHGLLDWRIKEVDKTIKLLERRIAESKD